MNAKRSGAAAELQIVTPDGLTRRVPLEEARYGLGRSAANELSYPDDPILSRQHIAFVREGDGWAIEDLGSKNGTLLNDKKLTGTAPLKPGDKVIAGRLIITYALDGQTTPGKLEFVEEPESTQGSATVVIRLDKVLSSGKSGESALGAPAIEALSAPALDGRRRTEALINAGRELVGHRPLGELFEVILRLATNAVGAKRGVLMIDEQGDLLVKAAQGEGFRISTAVRDKVMRERESLLVRDAGLDELLKGSRTIVEQRVRSLMAVPLQTEDKVIGLIYVDSPDFIRPFAQEDLSLLTVMANTAAMRIEHARLSEVEAIERAVAKELAQATEIQRSLVPEEAPVVEGLDLFGYSVACRAVGGDYFDFVQMACGRTAAIVGDVAGKGLPAALMMTSLQARVQILGETESDPGSVVTRLNRAVARHCPSNRVITFFLAALDRERGELAFANAGHNPPYVLRHDGRVDALEGGGPPLGILGSFAYQTLRVAMQPGDTLLLFSDGVTEAVNCEGEEYGEERLTAALMGLRGETAQGMVAGVRTSLAAFVGEAAATDDITLVVAQLIS